MIDLHELELSYGSQRVLRGIDLVLPDSGVTVITGPSGCGKTSLLRVLAGLEPRFRGRISGLAGKRIAMVFQEHRLLPWATVLDNVAFVVGGDRERAADALRQMELEQALEKYPAACSGGMQQRVALARALCYGGDLLLLDEPTTGLDSALADRVMPRLLAAWQGKPVVMVTHDEGVAERYGDLFFSLAKG